MSETWLSLQNLAEVWRIVYRDRKLYFFNGQNEPLVLPNKGDDYGDNYGKDYLLCNSGGLAKEIIFFISLLFQNQGEEFVISINDEEGEITAVRKPVDSVKEEEEE